MFSNERYKSKVLDIVDIYDGIIMFMYMILLVGVGYCFKNKLDNDFFGLFITIMTIEGLTNIFKLLLYIFFTGLNKSYEEIKLPILIIPCIISLPITGYSIFILITKIDEDIFILCNILSYVTISFFRIFNFIIFINS
jgi:hypothetical protein